MRMSVDEIIGSGETSRSDRQCDTVVGTSFRSEGLGEDAPPRGE